MFEFIPSLLSLLSYGTLSTTAKKAINDVGRHKAIVCSYAVLVVLAMVAALFLGVRFNLPPELILPFIAQIVIGGLGIIATYKALHHGKASLTAPIAKSHTLVVLVTGILLLGEALSLGQIAGSILILLSTFIIASEKGKLVPGPWLFFLGISVACRSYYYTFIKTFVLSMGAFEATVAMELGIAVFVVLFHTLRSKDLSPPSLKKGGVAYFNGILILFGSLLYSHSVALIGAALTATISAGTPMINAAASYFLLGEKLDPQKYAAICLMVIGLMMILLL